MNCLKCDSKLERMHQLGLAYCPQITKVTKSGQPYNRTAKIEEVGCGIVYSVSVNDWEYFNRVLPERYEVWRSGWKKS